MTHVRLTLFGGFTAHRTDGATLRFATRKTEALLAYLACRPGEPQMRERLAALLWGERADRQARHSRSQSLSSIRKVLNAGAAALITEGETVTLLPDAAQVDVSAFRRLAASESVAHLRAAADLYRGPLLDGLKQRESAYEEWLAQERAELHRLALAVLIGLAQREVAAGRCDQAAASLERALALDPLAEPVHRRLIRVRLDQGAYNAAIRHYRTCAEILKCELGTVPEPATTALYNEALSGLDNPRDPIAQASSVAVPGRASHASQSGTLDILLDRPAVAVIPFDNPGGDADERYFADGITDDIITTLSCWRVFPVIARNSTFGHRDGGDNAAQSAHKLGARYVLHGSVRRADRKIRISVQLIDANSGTQLWTQRYDRELGDIFAVQDEIAGCIVQSIEPQLNRAEQRRAMRKRPENLDGWDYTLRALARLHDFDRAATAEARDLLGRAIALDPLSSYAHSLLALSHFHDALGDWTRDPPERLAATLHAARRAVELDDDDWLSHALLGIALLWTSRQHDLAREEVERALALNPSAAVAHQFLGCILIFAGAPAEAITPLEAVLRLDPRYQTPALILADLSLSHLLLGDPDAAVGLSQRAIQRGQCNVRAYQRLTAALGHRGPKAEARAALDTLLRLQPRFCEAYVAATYPFRLSEHRAVFIEGLQRAGWRSGPA